MKPDLLMIAPLLPHTMSQLDAVYTLHRYDLAADKEALITQLAPHLKGRPHPRRLSADR